jgi:hypothetical protein
MAAPRPTACHAAAAAMLDRDTHDHTPSWIALTAPIRIAGVL